MLQRYDKEKKTSLRTPLIPFTLIFLMHGKSGDSFNKEINKSSFLLLTFLGFCLSHSLCRLVLSNFLLLKKLKLESIVFGAVWRIRNQHYRCRGLVKLPHLASHPFALHFWQGKEE